MYTQSIEAPRSTQRPTILGIAIWTFGVSVWFAFYKKWFDVVVEKLQTLPLIHWLATILSAALVFAIFCELVLVPSLRKDRNLTPARWLLFLYLTSELVSHFREDYGKPYAIFYGVLYFGFGIGVFVQSFRLKLPKGSLWLAILFSAQIFLDAAERILWSVSYSLKTDSWIRLVDPYFKSTAFPACLGACILVSIVAILSAIDPRSTWRLAAPLGLIAMHHALWCVIFWVY